MKETPLKKRPIGGLVLVLAGIVVTTIVNYGVGWLTQSSPNADGWGALVRFSVFVLTVLGLPLGVLSHFLRK